jgi:hypothetical protein
MLIIYIIIRINNIEDSYFMNNTCKKYEIKESINQEELVKQELVVQEWWTCKKCDKQIMESVYTIIFYSNNKFNIIIYIFC